MPPRYLAVRNACAQSRWSAVRESFYPFPTWNHSGAFLLMKLPITFLVFITVCGCSDHGTSQANSLVGQAPSYEASAGQTRLLDLLSRFHAWRSRGGAVDDGVLMEERMVFLEELTGALDSNSWDTVEGETRANILEASVVVLNSMGDYAGSLIYLDRLIVQLRDLGIVHGEVYWLAEKVELCALLALGDSGRSAELAREILSEACASFYAISELIHTSGAEDVRGMTRAYLAAGIDCLQISRAAEVYQEHLFEEVPRMIALSQLYPEQARLRPPYFIATEALFSYVGVSGPREGLPRMISRVSGNTTSGDELASSLRIALRSCPPRERGALAEVMVDGVVGRAAATAPWLCLYAECVISLLGSESCDEAAELVEVLGLALMQEDLGSCLEAGEYALAASRAYVQLCGDAVLGDLLDETSGVVGLGDSILGSSISDPRSWVHSQMGGWR